MNPDNTRFIPKRFKAAYVCAVCGELSNVGRRRSNGFICRKCLRASLNKVRHVNSLRTAEDLIRHGRTYESLRASKQMKVDA